MKYVTESRVEDALVSTATSRKTIGRITSVRFYGGVTVDAMMIGCADRLRTGTAAQRAAAARELAMTVRVPCGVIVALVHAAGDPDGQTRYWAAEALETAGPPSIADIGALVEVLLQAQPPIDGESAYWAARLLSRLGPTAAVATPALTHALLASPYLAVREQAAAALGRIGPEAQTAQEALETTVGSGSPRLVRLALAAMESIRGMAA